MECYSLEWTKNHEPNHVPNHVPDAELLATDLVRRGTRRSRGVYGVALCLTLIYTLVLMTVSFSPVAAAEDWEPFIQGLVQRGYYEEAIDYLETFRGRENSPELLRRDLDFRISLLQLELVRQYPVGERAARLQTCRTGIEGWLQQNSDNERAWEAHSALARIATERGRVEMESLTSGTDEATGTAKRTSARTNFQEAIKEYDEAVKLCGVIVEEQQSRPEVRPEEVDRIRGSYLYLKIQSASLLLDLAETWPEGASERTVEWTQARDAFQAIHESYQNYTGGYTAQYLQAKAEWLLGNRDAATGIIKEILILPNDPPFFTLKTQTLLLCGKMAEASKAEEDSFYFLEKYYDWKNLAPLPAVYYQYNEGLTIQLMAGRCLVRLVTLQAENRSRFNKILKDYFGEKDEALSKILTANSRLIDFTVATLAFVAGQKSPLADEAAELLRNPLLGQNKSTVPSDNSQDLGDVWRAADQSWTVWLRLQSDDPELSDEDKAKASEARIRIREVLHLAAGDLERDKICELLFREATIAWVENDWETAAVLGEYLTRQTDCNRSARSASYALGSLRRLYSQSRDNGADANELNAQKTAIADLAALIDRRFGNDRNTEAQSAVEEAVFVQIETALDDGDLTAANGLLTRIPENSVSRAAFELRYGQALYAAWGRQSAMTSSSSDSSTDKTTDKTNTVPVSEAFLLAAREQLQKGLTRKLSAGDSRSDDRITVWSALSLAQICLTKNDPNEAWKWLSHPVIGPYNVVSAVTATGEIPDSSDSFPDRGFIQKTLLLALRVKVNQGDFEESQKIMSRLESMNDQQSDQLVAIYVQLGRELEKELKQLGDAAASGDVEKQKQLEAVTKGFEQFLERISERSTTTSYPTSRWVADTFLSLARGMAGTLTDIPKEAIGYYTRAGRTYQSILKQVKADPSWCTDKNAEIFCTVRLSECLRGTGRFDAAMKVLVPVLTEHENNLELQIEAVRIYQNKGKINKDAYVQAIVGGETQTNGRNLVWGWNKIITRLNGAIDDNPRFCEIYYDAWLNKLTCRYLYLRRLTDPEERRKQAASAESEILRLHQSHPDMGGAATRKNFEDHLKRFRKQQEENHDTVPK